MVSDSAGVAAGRGEVDSTGAVPGAGVAARTCGMGINNDPAKGVAELWRWRGAEGGLSRGNIDGRWGMRSGHQCHFRATLSTYLLHGRWQNKLSCFFPIDRIQQECYPRRLSLLTDKPACRTYFDLFKPGAGVEGAPAEDEGSVAASSTSKATRGTGQEQVSAPIHQRTRRLGARQYPSISYLPGPRSGLAHQYLVRRLGLVSHHRRRMRWGSGKIWHHLMRMGHLSGVHQVEFSLKHFKTMLRTRDKA